MDVSTSVEWLSNAIAEASKAARFCIDGCLPAVDPGLEIEDLGRITLPLKRGVAKQIIARCQISPYGKGTQTLVDRKVRSASELDPQWFRLGDEWNSQVANTTREVGEQLGVPAEQLEARLYKLLVYERGDFFLPHRDSEKHDGMVASLVIVLPNPFQGGELVVRHGREKRTVKFEEAARGEAPCFAAFYADCEHEVERVTRGVRLGLAYNLVLKRKRWRRSSAKQTAVPADVLAESIGAWVAAQPTKPLVFALAHHYTERGLSFDLLKGGDRKLADLVAAAAENADCNVHLAQISRHLLQFADDGSFERGYFRHRRRPRHEIIIGETYEDELNGDQWTDARGKKQPWGEIALDPSSIVSPIPIDDWKPTSEDFEGYTGNAGNTLDRWYHRSALVVWHRDHHFDVIATSGAANSTPLFCSTVSKLPKTPKKRLEEARNDCIRFARAIISQWPHRMAGFMPSTREESERYDDYLDCLPELRDRESIAMLLSKVGQQDAVLRLKSFVVAACRKCGWTAFAEELKELLISSPEIRVRGGFLFRDAEWLSAFCLAKSADAGKAALAQELCALAVEQFCQPRPSQRTYYSRWYGRSEPTDAEKSLPPLLKAILESGRDEDFARVIRFVQESPDDFRLQAGLVPSLKTLVPWAKKRYGAVPPPLQEWLDSVREQLEALTAQAPEPPSDWTRPAEVSCKCEYCAQLKAFLADPENEVGRIPAREDIRRHLMDTINRHNCDVKHELERKGSPFSLVLTKTTGSFDRAVKEYETNRRLLRALPSAE